MTQNHMPQILKRIREIEELQTQPIQGPLPPNAWKKLGDTVQISNKRDPYKSYLDYLNGIKPGESIEWGLFDFKEYINSIRGKSNDK